VLTCPSCGTDNSEGSKFCNECGTRLEAAPVREERKVITALFCDLVGSTALGERLDAEDISRLLREYQTICRKRIESHGGVVEKFIGDAVVGVFGVPLAHEDDPERAVRAALRITEDVGASDLGIEVRIGVNTGEALVRLDVDPRSGEGFATGDTMNTAARLEAAAPVMGVAVGYGTHRASSRAIVYEELPAIRAKGKSEPLPAWQALRPIARVGTGERDRTPFVGRDLELSMLTQLFERSRSRPSTEFVTIIAEPGLGKSRLVRELARHVDQLPEPVTWREGRCLPYGDGISFWALGEIVKAQAGILETDDQLAISVKLERTITEPDAQTRAWMKDRLAPLVGLETETAPPEREEVFTAWRRFLEQISAEPTVFVIEDLHWADGAFVSFLEHLAERTAGLPLLVVVTARPEVEERHPSWPPGRRSTVLSLSPLDDADVQTLLQEALPDADPELIPVVLERAGGSPLYAEQLAAMLRERAMPIDGRASDETEIPASVQALIAARIDALPPEHKRVLMEASVLGKAFWTGAVSSLGEHEELEVTLGELVRREFCRPVHPSTMEGDTEFGFWHALVRDVAYAELTRAERARLHASTAKWIVDRNDGAFDRDAEIVVHHVDAAIEFAAAADELDAEQLTELLAGALIAAGEAAMRTEMPRAIPHLERALDALHSDDHRRFDVMRLLAISHSAAGDLATAVTLLEEVLIQHQSQGRLEAATDVALELAGPLQWMGKGLRVEAILAGLRAELGSAPSRSLANILSWDANRATAAGDFEGGVSLAGEAIKMAEALGVDPPPRALAARGHSRVAIGDLGGEAEVRLAVEGYVRRGEAHHASVPIFNLSVAMSGAGPVVALPYIEEAIELAERFGVEAETWSGRGGRLEALAEMGRFDEVVAGADPILEWAAASQDADTRLRVVSSLALVAINRGEPAVDPYELADLSRNHGGEISLILAAELLLAEDDAELARSLLSEAISHVMPTSAFLAARACIAAGVPELAEEFPSLGVVHYSAEKTARLATQAILAEAKGELAPACDGYAAAARLFEELGRAPDQGHTLQGLGRCLLRLGEIEEGVTRLRESRALWEDMKATRRIAEIDELLASASAPGGDTA
jgi:class 3 adenylate cyclase/tetratricopeptide (TPR) repeat protein